jgi:glycosyltransferase involved in cell wall biosynthesis
MHVLVIPSWYPLHENDIGGSFFRDQARSLQKQGCCVGVIYPEHRSLRDWKSIFTGKYGMTIEDDQGVKTYRWHTMRWLPSSDHGNSARWLRQGMQLFEAYIEKEGKPAIIHVHSILYGAVLAKQIREKYSIPFVITEHSSALARGLLKPVQQELSKSVVAHASRLIAVSPPLASLLEKSFGSKWQTVPNMVNDLFLSSPLGEPRHNMQEVFVYLCVARLVKNKRIDLLLNSFYDLLKDKPDAQLRIGGDGPARGELEQQVKRLGLSSHVFFLGGLARDDVADELARADVFVLPSIYETFGVVIIEALAMGVPVVATRCGGPDSIINNKNGLLVKVDDQNALTSALHWMYEQRESYDSSAIRHFCRDNFGEQEIVRQLKHIYQDVVVDASMKGCSDQEK